jgi:hypothetical protein
MHKNAQQTLVSLVKGGSNAVKHRIAITKLNILVVPSNSGKWLKNPSKIETVIFLFKHKLIRCAETDQMTAASQNKR